MSLGFSGSPPNYCSIFVYVLFVFICLANKFLSLSLSLSAAAFSVCPSIVYVTYVTPKGPLTRVPVLVTVLRISQPLRGLRPKNPLLDSQTKPSQCGTNAHHKTHTYTWHHLSFLCGRVIIIHALLSFLYIG